MLPGLRRRARVDATDDRRSAVDIEPARILTVCTGNICRSPAAERLLAQLGPAVQVASAGVRAVVGHPIDPPMAAMLRADGVDADGFAARQLTASEIREADLILVMTRAHRSWVVEEEPSALRRSFTLLEFARIIGAPEFPDVAGASPAERLRASAASAARHRHLGEVIRGDDVPDPYGRDGAAFADAYSLIAGAVRSITRSTGIA